MAVHKVRVVWDVPIYKQPGETLSMGEIVIVNAGNRCGWVVNTGNGAI